MRSAQGSIQSMTGYGRATTRTDLGTITVELRSTNHRYLDLDLHLPAALASLQGRLSELMRTHLRRGRIETFVTAHLTAWDQRTVLLDERLLHRYHEALVGLKARFGLKDAVSLDHLLSLPQALTISEERIPPERLWEPIRRTAQAAVQDLVRSRQREGAKLVADLRRQLVSIERHVRAIKRRAPHALKQQRQRLRERLQELLGAAAAWSAAQLEQAAALVRDAEIHEEMVRLESHLAYMRQTLANHRLVGKRLDFIAQELIREANTMGAKVNDPEAVQHVVDIKSCIEKIREQVQNLE